MRSLSTRVHNFGVAVGAGGKMSLMAILVVSHRRRCRAGLSSGGRRYGCAVGFHLYGRWLIVHNIVLSQHKLVAVEMVMKMVMLM